MTNMEKRGLMKYFFSYIRQQRMERRVAQKERER